MRFGLLGTGHWAAETHGAALAAHPDAELAGIWGRDPAKAEALADRYGTRAYTDADALIADVDAVAVALPPDIQSDLAERAARAGRHLLLDKPVAFTTAAADRIVAAAEERSAASVVFFTRRFAARAVAADLDTRADFLAMRDAGFDLVQGPLFGRPMNVRKFARTFRTRSFVPP